MNKVPVIDLFAGPGGLAEGFSSIIVNGERLFDIQLSIEKEENAHKTLELRSFCRQFQKDQLPDEYYDVIKESDLNIRAKKKSQLFKKYKIEYSQAEKEAWKAELGGVKFPPELVDERISEALNGYKNWVLIGGPPCQAFSIVGRSRVGGINSNDKRVYLYKEYLRIIATHQPAVFVMENVKGLLSAKIDGEEIFSWILRDLSDPNSVFNETKSKKYKIFSLVKSSINENNDYLIKSELYGIPQKRHRVILLGIRDDLKIIPQTLKTRDEISLKSVIGNLPKIRSELNRKFISSEIVNGKKKRKYHNLKDDPKLWEEYINSFKEEIIKWNGLNLYYNKKHINSPKDGVGAEYLKIKSSFSDIHPLKSWYEDQRLNGVTHHQTRGHLLEDLFRYIFASIFTYSEKRFPRLSDYEKHCDRLMPDHDNARSGKFNDRFRVQMPDIPATTVTSHISKDGHYFIHYDPDQCRSLTVREAARIQTFPDNYLFCGPRTAQFHQVGNAVPPFLAYQIADIVSNIILKL